MEVFAPNIIWPELQIDEFELKLELIKLVQINQFRRDPLEHMQGVLQICSTLKLVESLKM